MPNREPAAAGDAGSTGVRRRGDGDDGVTAAGLPDGGGIEPVPRAGDTDLGAAEGVDVGRGAAAGGDIGRGAVGGGTDRGAAEGGDTGRPAAGGGADRATAGGGDTGRESPGGGDTGR
jgi:hypothetical protein